MAQKQEGNLAAQAAKLEIDAAKNAAIERAKNASGNKVNIDRNIDERQEGEVVEDVKKLADK